MSEMSFEMDTWMDGQNYEKEIERGKKKSMNVSTMNVYGLTSIGFLGIL